MKSLSNGGTYLFYDIETSGLNKCFDQVLQFAAVRTDLNFNELERYNIFIKLNPDVIPSPTAMLIHQITLAQIQSGSCEYEAMRKIHGLFNTPGTITVGYNTLGFDDEFLRFSFYRNLLTPYTHQYANNCGRMDIYPMIVMYRLFKPDSIVWPEINGVVTLKLEHLNKANGLNSGSAHDAMNDVEATIALARLLKREEKMWEYLCGYFNKKIDLERMGKLSATGSEYQRALLVDGGIGATKIYQSPVVGLGMHNHYKNQTLWLPLDAFSFAAITADNIATTTFVSRKRLGEPPILLPLTERFGHYLNNERLQLVESNCLWMKENPELLMQLIEYHKEYKYPEIPHLDVDAALYQLGFMSNADQIKCEKFHAADSVREKSRLVENFSSMNLQDQAIRVLGRNYSQDLMLANGDLYKKFGAYVQRIRAGEVFINYKNEPHLTPKVALAEIECLRKTKELTVDQNDLLDELVRYIQSW